MSAPTVIQSPPAGFFSNPLIQGFVAISSITVSSLSAVYLIHQIRLARMNLAKHEVTQENELYKGKFDSVFGFMNAK